MSDQMEHDPDYLIYFIDGIYRQIKARHEEYDLEKVYQGKEFPTDHDVFTLGGYDSVLFRMHIDFSKQLEGWSIKRFYLTR
jgi:hypothetical protein